MDIFDVFLLSLWGIGGLFFGRVVNILIDVFSHKFQLKEFKFHYLIPSSILILFKNKIKEPALLCFKHRIIIELLCIVLFIITYLKFLNSINTILISILLGFGIVIFVIDYKYMIIPDTMQLGILCCIVFYNLFSKQYLYATSYSKIIGCIFILIISIFLFILEYLLNKELLGFGDLKLLFIFSMLVGFKLLLIGIFFSSFIALLFVLIRKTKDKMIPFGPFLIISFSVIIFYGDVINELIKRVYGI